MRIYETMLRSVADDYRIIKNDGRIGGYRIEKDGQFVIGDLQAKDVRLFTFGIISYVQGITEIEFNDLVDNA